MLNGSRRYMTLFVASVLLFVRPCLGQPASDTNGQRQRARELGYAGVHAYAAGEHAAASVYLEQAFALLPVPSLGLWSARCLAKLGKLVEADARYRRIAQMQLDARAPDVQHAAQHTAALEQSELAMRLPRVQIEISGAKPQDVKLSLDGVPLSPEQVARALPINPGVHSIRGLRAGDHSEVILSASEGRTEHVLLRFLPADAPALPATAAPPSPPLQAGVPGLWRTGGWIALGTGGASSIVSAVAFLVGRSQYSELQRTGVCRGDRCLRGDALDNYTRTRTLQISSLIAAGVLGAAGAALFWLEPGTPRVAQARFELRFGLGSAGVAGSF
jgi:hypothetical protein